MSDSTSAITGLIPIAIASGIAVKTSEAMLSKKKAKRKTKKAKKMRVTSSKKRSRKTIDKWIG